LSALTLAVVPELDWRQQDGQALIPPMVEGLVQLVQHMTESATTTQVLDLLAVVIDTLEHKIAPFAPHIIGTLSRLWSQTDQRQLIRAAILRNLASLMAALAADPNVPQIIGHLLPLIDLSTDLARSTDYLILHEEGLNLWFRVLQLVEPATLEATQRDAFTALLQRLEPIMHNTIAQMAQLAHDTHGRQLKLNKHAEGYQIPMLFRIVHAYLLLGQASFATQHRDLLVRLFVLAVQHTRKSPKLEHVLSCLVTFMQLLAAQPVLSLLEPVFAQLYRALLAHFKDTPGGHAICAVFARLALLNRESLLAWLHGHDASEVNTLGEHWTRAVLDTHDYETKRTCVLGLCHVLGTPLGGPSVARTVEVIGMGLMDLRDMNRDVVYFEYVQLLFLARGTDVTQRRRRAVHPQEPRLTRQETGVYF
jgi:hypothetical protein